MLVAVTSTAAPITKQQASKLAKDFMDKHGITVNSKPLRAPIARTTVKNEPLYIFNAEQDKGFVIVSGDDAAEQILGYTTSGHYDEDNIPDNFRSWLEQCSWEISALSNIQTVPTQQRVPVHTAVDPLIKSKWDQGYTTQTGYIYNTLTPTVNGKHCFTGCTATAGAQLMYYYMWPQDATKTVPKYYWKNQSDSLDALPSITFDWAKMKATYTQSDTGTESEKAVSELMRYCGQASQMNYGLSGSSASTYNLAEGMANCFDYDPYTWSFVWRDNYSVAEWDQLIYGEISAGRPVIYAGSSWAGAHAFLCDGYDGNGYYHFNWGWGGDLDGYFKLHVTDPYQQKGNIGYVIDQYAVIGIQPNTGVNPDDDDAWKEPVPDEDDTWETITLDGIRTTTSIYSIEGNVVTYYMLNYNDKAYQFGFGLGEMNSDGSFSVINTDCDYYAQWSELPIGSGWGVSYNLSSLHLSEGTHNLIFLSRESSSSEWLQCRPAETYLEVIVEGKDITIIQHPIIKLEATDFNCFTSRLPYNWQSIAFKLSNLGENGEFPIYINFKKAGEEQGGYLSSLTRKIKSGSAKTCVASFYSDEPGTYDLEISTDRSMKNVIGKTQVEIGSWLKATNIRSYPNFIAYDVENHGGNFSGRLCCFLSKTEEKVFFSTSGSLRIKSGEKASGIFANSSLATYEPGTYNVWIATDYQGSNVIGQAQIDVNTYDVKVTDFNIKGSKLVNKDMEIIATVSSMNQEYAEPLYLFASKDSEKGNCVYAVPTAIEADQSEDVTFRISFSEEGTWNLWVCSDMAGENIVGQTTVDIIQPPTDLMKLELTSFDIQVGSTVEVAISLTNVSTVSYYDDIKFALYRRLEGSNSYQKTQRKVVSGKVISPRETIDIDTSFDDIASGDYLLYIHYYKQQGTNNKILLKDYYFTYDGDDTGVGSLSEEPMEDTWLTLEGIRLSERPVCPGIYIKNGKKVVVGSPLKTK